MPCYGKSGLSSFLGYFSFPRFNDIMGHFAADVDSDGDGLTDVIDDDDDNDGFLDTGKIFYTML